MNISSPENKRSRAFDFKSELIKYIVHWKWFVLNVSFFVVFTIIYLRYTEVQYKTNIKIIFKSDEKSNLGELMPIDLGLTKNANLKDNQIQILKTRSLITKTLNTLEFNKVYVKKGLIKASEVYKDESPITVKFLKEDSDYYKLNTNFTITGKSKSKFILLDKLGNSQGEFTYGEPVNTANGYILVNLNPKYYEKNINDFDFEILVNILPMEMMIDLYMVKLNVVGISKTTDIVDLSIVGPNPKKSEDFLGTLIEIYNQEAINDERLVSKKTVNFVDERLELITTELKDLEIGTEEFKKINKVTDIESQAGIYLQSADTYESTMIGAQTDLSIIDAMIGLLASNSADELIPTGIVPEGANAEGLIAEYNRMVLDRNRIIANSSKLNPTAIQLDQKIQALRKSIKASLLSLKKSISIKISNLDRQEKLIDSRIAKIPKQERQYREITRKQEVKEALYVFLIEKRENAAILMEVAAPISKVIDEPYTAPVPVFPKKGITLFGSLLLGFAIPGFIIYLINFFDTKVKTRKDVEDIIPGFPYLGDVPSLPKLEGEILPESRSGTAEALRMLRTNVDFMLTGTNNSLAKVIFVTSSIPGEGKTFISMNLAKTISFTSKKVLLLGFDIRKPKLDEYLDLPPEGITNYLLNDSLKLDSLTVKHPTLKNLYVIGSGAIPPNPSELLLSDNVGKLFEELKTKYDYIIVDTAPVALVTDTLLLSKHSDLFIYVVRSNYLESKMLDVTSKIYKDAKIKNMAYLLNDTEKKMNGYGYGYGSSTGYYLSSTPKEESFFKRLFK